MCPFFSKLSKLFLQEQKLSNIYFFFFFTSFFSSAAKVRSSNKIHLIPKHTAFCLHKANMITTKNRESTIIFFTCYSRSGMAFYFYMYSKHTQECLSKLQKKLDTAILNTKFSKKCVIIINHKLLK